MVGELDPRTREMIEEVRELGRTYMRPMGLEADASGMPPPADHPFYYLCAKRSGLVSGFGGAEVAGGSPMGVGLAGGGAGEGTGGATGEGAGGGTGEGASVGWEPFRNLLVQEEAAYWDRGITLSLPGPGLGGAALRSVGTSEQRERFLAPFRDRSRPHWGAMAMTEPGAGSDVARIQTRCYPDGDGWVLKGSKMFCSNGARAEWVVVWATVDPRLGREGHRAFVVEQGTPGFELLRIEHKMGSRGYETASFSIGEVRVPHDNLLGGDAFYQSRRGFKGAMATFNLTRPIHAMHGVGMGRAALDLAVELVCSEYPAHGRRRTRALERIANIRRELHAARLVCMHAVWLASQGQPNGLEASYAKLYTPPVVFRAVSAALDIYGEAGVQANRYLEKLYRDVKILDIGEGTQQVQRLVVARRLLGYPREG